MENIFNKKMKIEFICDADGLYIKRLENRIAGEAVEFIDADFALVTGKDGNRRLYRKDLIFQGITYQDATKIVCYWLDAENQLKVEQIYLLDDFVLKLKVLVSNCGTQGVFLKDLIIFNASVEKDINLAGEDNNFRIDTQPVFIDRHTFLGIDWPVAQNVIQGKQILCKQFCAKVINPAAIFESRSFSIGVGTKENISEAFLTHINKTRGRETRRASLYFDWLTHASEGLTDEEMKKLLAFLRMLNTEYGIQFDIFSVDDGIVETRWGITYDRYKLQHESLFPNGIKYLTEDAKSMNMGFGVWIGPDGFGDTEESYANRVDTVVNMVRDWNVNLFKLDICVAPLLGDDPYVNEDKMCKLEMLVEKCREVNPELIVINHRVSLSPYILTILDSTLWEGAEGYPELMLYNSAKSRLFTRHASYGRGKPSYYGAYSQLLEDHGVCFNGMHEGWAEELIVHAFGRALMLSPEIYGALFLLPDSEYPELGRLMKLAAEKRSILSNTSYIDETGDFLHTNGSQSIICMINDSWNTVTREIKVGEAIGLSGSIDKFSVIRHYPLIGERDGNIWNVKKGDSFSVKLGPFSACLLEVLPEESSELPQGMPMEHRILTLAEERMDVALVELGRFDQSQCSAGDVEQAERVRFAISSDPIEAQQMKRVGRSKHEEVNACRRFFYNKLRHECFGIAENAWDNDNATAWGDAPYCNKTENIWRLDLGGYHNVRKIEIKLSHLWYGPVFELENGRKLKESVIFEVSEDAKQWFRSTADVYYIRAAFIDGEFPDKLIAEFDDLPKPVRYIRLHFKGVLVQHIKIMELKCGELIEISSGNWQGNNLLTARTPKAMYHSTLQVDKAWDGRYLVFIVRLPGDITIPMRRENAIAWVESEAGEVWNVIDASPAFPFHPWECQGDDFYANSWTLRLALTNDMTGKRLTAKLAWYGAESLSGDDKDNCLPEVTGWLAAVK